MLRDVVLTVNEARQPRGPTQGGHAPDLALIVAHSGMAASWTSERCRGTRSVRAIALALLCSAADRHRAPVRRILASASKSKFARRAIAGAASGDENRDSDRSSPATDMLSEPYR